MLVMAVSVALLSSILMFGIVPGFVGRLALAGLIAGGVAGIVVRSNLLEMEHLWAKDGLICLGIYGGALVILAGLM